MSIYERDYSLGAESFVYVQGILCSKSFYSKVTPFVRMACLV